jgi:hypothetical protein
MSELSKKSYSRKLVRHASERTKDNMTVELVASTLIGIAGSVVGFSVSGIALAVASGVLFFAATIGLIFLGHLVLSPRSLDRDSGQTIVNLEGQFKRLTEHKLVFEVDERKTRVNLYEPDGQLVRLAIAAKIALRFENKDIHPISMKRLNVTLHKLQPEQPAKDIDTTITFIYSSSGTRIKDDDFEGMMIQGRTLTPFYLVEAILVIDDDEVKKADDLEAGLHFLRVTMDAGGYQPPFFGDLFLSWKHALEERGTSLTITFNAPAIREDHRRI